MKTKSRIITLLVGGTLSMFIAAFMPLHDDSTICKASEADSPAEETNKYLYVAVPGLRDYLEFGGHGLLVFDIEDDYRFVKRIPVAGRRIRSDYGRERLAGQPSNVKGITASLATNSIYISNLETMQRIDLNTEQVVWEYQYGGGADRMAISSDGKIIYLPSLERDHWNVVDAESGRVIKSLYTGNHGAHNTVFGLDGKKVYLGGLRTNSLGVVDAQNHEVIRQIGPLGGEVRPFTINGSQTLAYINVNGLLGFEIGNIETGELMHRIDVTREGFEAKRPLRHGVYSHGVGLTPDEREVWVVDGANSKLHIYDNTVMPPTYVESIKLRKQPGWITFSLDGQHAYAPTGEIIDVETREVVAQLIDEHGAAVKSEKMIEVHLNRDREAVAKNDQFGIGRVLGDSRSDHVERISAGPPGR
jgi:DNA-binding beta-propeller fold protein YncE